MFVHRQQGSRPAVGWQPAADRHGRRSLLVRPVRRVRVSETRWSHRPPLAGGTDVRRCRAHVVRRREPGRESACALVGTDIIKVLTNRKPLPLQMAAEFYAFYRLLWAFLCRLGQNLDICAMRANSQS